MVTAFFCVKICWYLEFFVFQAEDGIRDRSPSRGLGDVYKRQAVDLHHDLPDPTHTTVPTVPHPWRPPGWRPPGRLRTALQPASTGFELVEDQEASRHRFLTCTFPSCSPDPAHPAVLDRPDFVAAAPTQPRRSPGPGCRQLHPTATTAKRCRSLTSIRNNSASWRTTCSSTPITLTSSKRAGSSISSRRPSARTALFAVFHDTASASAIRATLRCAMTSPSNAQPSARRDSFERGSAAAVVSWRQTCPQPMQRYRRSVISSTVGRHPNGS